MAIKAIPTKYSGVQFRSQLEANWAATFDQYGIEWIYEPEAYRIPNINYLPDFYLPEIRFWAEAKGPLNLRLDKTIEFQKALDARWARDFDDDWEHERQLVVILRPEVRGMCAWEAAAEGVHITMARCPRCGPRLGFMDRSSNDRRCRYGCESYSDQFWEEDGGDLFFSVGDTTFFSDHKLPFFRAPRPFGWS